MYVQRDLEDHFRLLSSAAKIIAVVGPRQCGKTTFLDHFSKEMDARYVTFDDPDVRSIFSDVKAFEQEYIRMNEITILDEVQYGSDPGIKLKYLADRGHRFWITSSSEILLSKEVLSYLVGRVSIQRLYPFNLFEMARSKGYGTMTEEMEKRVIDEHIRFGGYPGIVTQDSAEVKVDLLRSLYETLLLKDISRSFSIEDLESMRRLTRFLALGSGSSFPIESISSDLGLSFQTVKKYLDALFKSYLIIGVPPFFTNRRLEIIKQQRYYYLDLGLKNAIINDFPLIPDGRSFENYVISELYKAGLAPRYWRTKGGAEVDIVLEIGKEVIPIEVKLTLDSMRVEKGMRSFIERYSPERAFILRYKGIVAKKRLNGCEVNTVGLKGFLETLTQNGFTIPP
jgi:predicted AAA+ superfamily ATPase